MRPEDVAEATVKRLMPLLTGEPLLWTVKTAKERTGIPRDRIFAAFHAGELEGLWSSGVRGSGSILLKPESVLAWIDRQANEQGRDTPRGVGREEPPMLAGAERRR